MRQFGRRRRYRAAAASTPASPPATLPAAAGADPIALDTFNRNTEHFAFVHLAFLLICLFVLITTFGLTDHALLIGQQVHVPVLDVDIPLRGFFHVAAAVVALSHLSVLVQGAFLARDLLALRRREGGTLPDSTLTIYPFVQYLRNPRSRALRGVLSLLVNTSIVCLGAATLLAMQLRMLAWQDEALNWAFRGWLLLDVLCIALLWPRVLYPKHTAGAIWRHWLFGGAKQRWRLAYWLITLGYLAWLVFSVRGLDGSTPLSWLPLLLGPLAGLMALRGWWLRLRMLLLGLLPCALGLLIAFVADFSTSTSAERAGFGYLALSSTAIAGFVGGLFWWWFLPVLGGRKMRGARLLPVLVLSLPLPSLALLTRGERLELTLTDAPPGAIYDTRRETAYSSLFSRWRALDVSGTRIAGDSAEQPLIIKGRSLLGLQAQGVQMRHVALVNSALSGADFSGAVIRDSGVDIGNVINLRAENSEWLASDLSLPGLCLNCSFAGAVFDQAQLQRPAAIAAEANGFGSFAGTSFMHAFFRHSLIADLRFHASTFAGAQLTDVLVFNSLFAESSFAHVDQQQSVQLERVLLVSTHFENSQLWPAGSARQLVLSAATARYPDAGCQANFPECARQWRATQFGADSVLLADSRHAWLGSSAAIEQLLKGGPVPPATQDADCLTRGENSLPYHCQPIDSDGRLLKNVPWLATQFQKACTDDPLLLELLLASRAYALLLPKLMHDVPDASPCNNLRHSPQAQGRLQQLNPYDEFQRRYR